MTRTTRDLVARKVPRHVPALPTANSRRLGLHRGPQKKMERTRGLNGLQNGTEHLNFYLGLNMDFEIYWQTIQPDARYDNRKEASRQEWEQHPEKHAAIMSWLRRHGPYPQRNPYFFIQDFTVRAAKTEPENWNGRALDPKKQYVTAKYNGRYGTYTVEDAERFGMERANN